MNGEEMSVCMVWLGPQNNVVIVFNNILQHNRAAEHTFRIRLIRCCFL
jgi:hypothetical protein